MSQKMLTVRYTKNPAQLHQKIKVEFPYDPAIPFLGAHPKEQKAGGQREVWTPTFTAALFITAKRRKNPRVHQRMLTNKMCPSATWNIIWF